MDTFAAAMVYVMLSRVCSLIQIFILNEFDEKKMYPNQKAINELKRLEKLCLNNNLTEWEQDVKAIKIYSLNCRSLKKHYQDIKSDSLILQSSIICLQETWLDDDEDSADYEIPSYETHKNSYGPGKGILIYFKKDTFTHITDVKQELMQLSKFRSPMIDVITLYRSQEGKYEILNSLIEKLVTRKKPTLIIGDFNFCYHEQSTLTKRFLEATHYTQLVTEPTHIEGRILDQAYMIDRRKNLQCLAEVHSKYFTDHKGIAVLIKVKVKKEKVHNLIQIFQEN